MKEINVRLALKTVIVIGLTIVGIWAISTHEGSVSSMVILGIAFICVILMVIVSILETYKEKLKRKIND